jgi:nucleoside-diphosphate-sugar epimerase
MKILLTGGGGFLGGFLIPQLLEAGHNIVALSRSTRSSDHKNLSWVEMDIAEGVEVDKLPKNIDGVIHLAQSPEYRNGSEGEPHVLKVNVVAQAQLLKYAEKAGVKQFVLASTGSVYEPFTNSMSEDSLPSPTGFYGASKLAAEVISQAYADRMGICNLRVFFLFGPGQENAFIARLIENIKNSKPITLPASGEGLVFVPTFAKNTAHVFKTALEDKWTGTYNVASPQAISVKSLAEEIGNAFNKEVIFERTEQSPPAPIIPPLDKLADIYDLEQFSTVAEALKEYS